ncbi:MAG: arsenate reductase family protein [Candidatus Dormibacteraceae bacterium]
MNKLYLWTRCSTCRIARQLLFEAGINFEERDWFADPLKGEELDQLAERVGGVQALVAVQSPSFRKLGRQLETISAQELRELVLAEPRLLRRPLLITHDGMEMSGIKAIRDYVRHRARQA